MSINVADIVATITLKDQITSALQAVSQNAARNLGALQNTTAAANAEVGQLKKQLLDANTAAERLTIATKLGEATDGAVALRTELGNNVAAIQQLNDATQQSGVSTAALADHLKGAFENPRGAVQSLAGSITTEFVPVLGVAGIAIGAVAAALLELGVKAASIGATLNDLGDKTGISVPALSRLQNAAAVAGTDINMLANAVFTMQQHMSESPDKFEKGLERMGIDFEEFKRLAPEQQLLAIADGLHTLDGTERTAASVETLGRAARELVPSLLNMNTAMERTADLSPWTVDEARHAREFEMQVAELKLRFEDLFVTLGRDVLPTMLALLDGFRNGKTHIVDMLGPLGAFVDQWARLKGMLGENALAAEIAAAKQAVINNAIKLGAPATIAYGDAVKYVNDKFRELHASQDEAAIDTTKLLADWQKQINDAYQKQQNMKALAGAIAAQPGFVPGQTFDFAGDMAAQKAREEALKKLRQAQADLLAAQIPLTKAQIEQIDTYKKLKLGEDEIARLVGVHVVQIKELDQSEKDQNKELDETLKRMDAFQKIGVSAAEALGKQLAPALRQLGEDMGTVERKLLVATQSFQNFLRATQLAPGVTGLSMGVGLMVDLSKQAADHMDKVRHETDQTTVAIDALGESLSRLGHAEGGTFGKMLTDLSQITKVINQYRAGDITGAEAGTSAAQIGFGAVAQATANPDSTAGYVANGAATGASIGTSVMPGYGTAVGAGAGALVGWIVSMKEWRKVTSDIQRDFGNIHISEDLAKAIDTIENQTGLGRLQASLTQLDKIIAEAGGLRADNVTLFTQKLHDTFSMIEMGSMTTAQVTQILDKNFADFATAATDANGRLSASMKEIIDLDQRFGTHSAAVTQYLQQQASTAATGFDAVVAGMLDVAGNLKIWDDAKAKIANTTTSAADLAIAQKTLTAGAASAAGGLADLGVQAVATYAAMVAEGKTSTEALTAIHPGLVNLEKAYQDLGLNVDDVALKQLMFRDQLLTAAPQLATAISGLSGEFIALDNMGLMNAQTFAAMERTGQSLFERLHDKVADLLGPTASLDDINKQTLGEMQDYLHNAAHEADLLKVPLDANTQAMIDQSRALGIWQDDAQKAKTPLDRLVDAVQRLVDTLRGVPSSLPDPFKNWTIPPTSPDEPPPDAAHAATGGYVTALGMQYFGEGGTVSKLLSSLFVPRGTDVIPAMLSVGETVLSKPLTDALIQAGRSPKMSDSLPPGLFAGSYSSPGAPETPQAAVNHIAVQIHAPITMAPGDGDDPAKLAANFQRAVNMNIGWMRSTIGTIAVKAVNDASARR